MKPLFWSSVDLTGNQTRGSDFYAIYEFWSSVDLTGNQTRWTFRMKPVRFWSSVDLTGNQTRLMAVSVLPSFGAVSI